ncbi:hypothetical protein BDV96DRAFT_183992 [Lophiotrema nucula]|uniref:Uncharacterized protein n=1 Tax=Lophiotrema nucula TaxID=690887 RepID=A0A6A5YZF6_9PLEO|nr:hypothetical protein BDV96DRAFT_183992 [Lophiotrema nucula]
MPVVALRGRDDRVEYVVVRRTVTESEREVEEMVRRYEPTETVEHLLSPANERRDHSFDHDDDDSDDEHEPDFKPTPVLVTMTFPQAQATGGALADNDPTETVVVQFTPNPPPPPPHRPDGNKGGISQTTEHLLIAAGSIGATIIVVMVLLAIHTMRKRGLTLAEAVKHGRYQVTRRGPPPPPKGSTRDKQAFDDNYGSMRNNSVLPPQPAVARSGSFSSQRPLMAPQRNTSFRTERSVSPHTVPQSFLLDSSPRRNNTITSHRRNNSDTPSSPVLPLQTQRESESTHNTQSVSEGSELQFPEPPAQRALSPLPPPPTFKQFLYNRPSQSGQPRIGPMISRFSWTNSNAPQTPRHEFNRDTNSHAVMRDSYMTQRSSVPRFRTVDSWVQQQSNRIEEQKLKDQFRLTSTSTVYSGDDENPSIPEVPEVPRHYSKMGEAGPSNVTASQALASNPVTPQPQPTKGLPGKNIKHERHDTQMTVETAPIFRQHPGTEVRFSTRSTVPSEILNGKMMPNVLS